MPDDNRSLPILIVSCDRYEDLWRPFFELFWRYWPDCPHPIYLGSNFRTYQDPRVRPLPIGKDVNWADGVRSMLDAIGAERVIVLLEDFLLMQPVDQARVERLAAIARSEQVDCMRLYSIFRPEHPVPGYPELGELKAGDNWRVTAQAAIWRTETLRQLLVPGFSPWDFEMIGSQMSEHMPMRIWCVNEPVLVYDHAVEKGKWRPQGLAICRAGGVVPDLERRGSFTLEELEQHEQSGRGAAELAEQKTLALNTLRDGKRSEGLRHLAKCLRRQPFSIQLWSIAVAGLIGSPAIRLLQRANIQWKIAKATRAHARAVKL